MSEALTYLYQIFSAFISLVFDTFELFANVTIGWVLVVIMLFGMMIGSILNLPRGVRFHGRNDNNRN